MKILLLTPDLPFPSESGAALRNIGLIRGLAAAGHDITLLSFAEQSADPAANPLFSLCEAVDNLPLPRHGRLKRVLTLLQSDSPDMKSRLASERLERRLRAILGERKFDIIQFSGLEMGHYLPLIRSERRGAKVIYDALNAEAELQRLIAAVDQQDLRRLPAALYSTLQSRRLARYETSICQGVDAVIAVSDEDANCLRRQRGAPVFVVPNGIAAADYAPRAENRREPDTLVFSGKMDYRPNVDAAEWFCGAILPRVRRSLPQTALTIVGRNPHARIRRLDADPQIRVTGWVESVEPYLHRTAIYIAPLRMGSGTRLKILQAMAARCAVVSTSIGAAGLNEETRGALVIADEAAAFADAIVRLLNDERGRLALGIRAQRQVVEHYDWSALVPRLLRAYAELGFG